MKTIGYIRFSYLGRSDVLMSRQDRDTEDDYFNELFAPSRMNDRFHLFERICLPSIRFQTDPDFQVVVLASPSMPQIYKARLETAVADIPQVILHYDDKPRAVEAFDEISNDLMTGHKGPSVHFRLDDDDAIACNVVHNLKRLGRHAMPGTLLSMPTGCHLFDHSGRPYLVPKFEPYIAIALAFVNPEGRIRNPYRCAHKREFKATPSLMDPNPTAYIHTASMASDTRVRHERRFARVLSQVPNYDDQKFQARLSRKIERFFPGFTPNRFYNALNTLPSRAAELDQVG